MSRRSWAFDIALAVVVCVLGQLEAWYGIDATHRQGPHWAEALLYGVTGLLLVVRRVEPIGCLAAIVVVSAAEFAVFGSPEGQGVALPAVVAAYTIGSRVDRRRSWWGLVLVVVLWAAWAGLDPMNRQLGDKMLTLIWLAPWVISWLLGALMRATRQAAESRGVAREERALAAVSEERNRIARELHDVIGHSVSVMTVQASAVRRLMRADQVKERQALETVEATGREALAEMRRMVGVLRADQDQPDLSPPPTLSQLGRLAENFRNAGLDVALESDGHPVALPPGLDLTAYRLIQEALTNTLKHAGATRAVVQVHYRADALDLSVRDDGRGVVATVQPGHGLLGMRERVGVYGGALVAGPAEGGGFELRAELPLAAT